VQQIRKKFPKVVQHIGKVWWEIINICVANFISFLGIKNFKSRLRFDKVTESFKVGTFLRHIVFKCVLKIRNGNV